MAEMTPVNSFAMDVHDGVHDLNTAALTVALCASANAPVATNTVLANLTEIAYTNLSTRAIAVNSFATVGARAEVNADDLVLTASGGNVETFRYAVLYNDTAASDNLIGWWDLGQDITILDGNTHKLNFDGATNILITIG